MKVKNYKDIVKRLGAVRKRLGPNEKEDAEAMEEAMDIVSDYEKAAAQAASLMYKYEMEERPIRRGTNVYTCPLCGRKVEFRTPHCGQCGKALAWDRPARKSRRKGG